MAVSGQAHVRWFARRPKAGLGKATLVLRQYGHTPEADLQFLYQRVNERVWDDRQRDAFLSVLHQLVWRLPLRRSHYAACLARLGIPTHAIWGDKDVINRLETARELVARQPNARLTVLPEVGHLPQQEAPEALLRAVL
ncbi:MAG: alpha/beta fold hydrolase [Candidatus Methylumidiphilus sp.]